MSFGSAFCKALGLDPDVTQDIVLHVEVGDIVWFEAKHLLRDRQSKRVNALLTKRKFQMVNESEPIDLRDGRRDRIADTTTQGAHSRQFTT